MMKLGIMQPYLFPYIGYFQLIHSVDTFVLYDDIQYRKGGWINRNRVLMNGDELLWSFSVQSDSITKNINERYFTDRLKRETNKFLKTLQMAYGQAPYFSRTNRMAAEVFEIMEVEKTDENIALKIGRSIEHISEFLGLKTEFMSSSNLKKDNSLDGQQQILEIAHHLDAETYINPEGGQELYSRDRFIKEGIDLKFIQAEKKTYPQFSEPFVPWLSIIDVCMFNSPEEISKLLETYSLIPEIKANHQNH